MHLATIAPDFKLMCWFEQLATTKDPEIQPSRFIGTEPWREIIVELRKRVFLQLDEILRSPLRVQQSATGRQVVLLETWAYGIDEQARTVGVSIFTSAGVWVRPDHQVAFDFDTFLSERNWRKHVAVAVEGRLRNYLRAQRRITGSGEGMYIERPFPKELHAAFWRDVSVGLAGRIRAGTRIKPLRLALRAALNVEPALIELARRSRINTRMHRVSAPWLTFVWQQRDVLERVRLEAPTVLAPAAELSYLDPDERQGDPVQQLRRWLTTEGVGKTGWLKLLRHSARPYQMLLTDSCTSDALDCLANALKITSSVDIDEPVCQAVWTTLLTRFDKHRSPKFALESALKWPKKIFAESARRTRRAIGDGTLPEFLLAEWTPILTHLLDDKSFEANQLRSGWKCWLRHANEEAQRERAKIELITWRVAVPNWTLGEFRFERIDNTLDLYEEGVALHHCAKDLTYECTSGKYRIYRVFGPGQRATLGLEWTLAGWSVNELRTYCNRPVFGRMRTAACALAQRYQQRFPRAHAQVKAHPKARPALDATDSQQPLTSEGTST